MQVNEIVSNFILELRRGTIILCVLNKMKKSSYGYNLIDNLANNGIFVEANTLYPLLRRLENQGLIQGTWNTEGTKPRKYYIITEMGEQALELMNKHWKDTIKNINSILEGSSDD